MSVDGVGRRPTAPGAKQDPVSDGQAAAGPQTATIPASLRRVGRDGGTPGPLAPGEKEAQ